MSRFRDSRRGGKRAWAVAAAAAAAVIGMTAMTAAPAAAKTGPVSVAYIEVNSNQLSNVGKYKLPDGSNAFDIAIIFAANINSDGQGGANLYLNDQVKATLANAATQIRPLQAKGIKVSLSVLGNHQAAGFANFSSQAKADEFASEVAAVVNQYGLDGVDLDDEFVSYGSTGVPAPVAGSAGWLVNALDTKLPGKLVTLYDIGQTASQLKQASSTTIAKLDYIWNPYYGTYNPPQFPGVAKSKLGAAAIDISATSSSTAASLATRTKTDGYGVYVTYNLTAGDKSAYISSFTSQLYGQNAIYTP